MESENAPDGRAKRSGRRPPKAGKRRERRPEPADAAAGERLLALQIDPRTELQIRERLAYEFTSRHLRVVHREDGPPPGTEDRRRLIFELHDRLHEDESVGHDTTDI